MVFQKSASCVSSSVVIYYYSLHKYVYRELYKLNTSHYKILCKCKYQDATWSLCLIYDKNKTKQNKKKNKQTKNLKKKRERERKKKLKQKQKQKQKQKYTIHLKRYCILHVQEWFSQIFSILP